MYPSLILLSPDGASKYIQPTTLECHGLGIMGVMITVHLKDANPYAWGWLKILLLSLGIIQVCGLQLPEFSSMALQAVEFLELKSPPLDMAIFGKSWLKASNEE